MNRLDKEIDRLALDVILLDGEQDEAPDLADMARRAKAILAKRDEERRHKAPAKVIALPGKSKEQRDETRLLKYQAAKRVAAERAGARFVSDGVGSALVVQPPRCEEYTNGKRCTEEGVDPDHVLGGAYRQECERLGSDGLMIRCRAHHEQKHANLPSRAYQLNQAKEHAIRIGSRSLLALVEKAIARNEMKHPSTASRETR